MVSDMSKPKEKGNLILACTQMMNCVREGQRGHLWGCGGWLSKWQVRGSSQRTTSTWAGGSIRSAIWNAWRIAAHKVVLCFWKSETLRQKKKAWHYLRSSKSSRTFIRTDRLTGTEFVFTVSCVRQARLFLKHTLEHTHTHVYIHPLAHCIYNLISTLYPPTSFILSTIMITLFFMVMRLVG